MSSDRSDLVNKAAREATRGAQAKLREQVGQRSAQAGEQINQQASDLRSVGEMLRQHGMGAPALAADRLAGYVERIGAYLGDAEPNALLADAEEFGRSRPWAVAAGGVALGFAASRLLKASSRERHHTHAGDARVAGSAEAMPPAPGTGRQTTSRPVSRIRPSARPTPGLPVGHVIRATVPE